MADETSPQNEALQMRPCRRPCLAFRCSASPSNIDPSKPLLVRPMSPNGPSAPQAFLCSSTVVRNHLTGTAQRTMRLLCHCAVVFWASRPLLADATGCGACMRSHLARMGCGDSFLSSVATCRVPPWLGGTGSKQAEKRPRARG